MRRLDLSHVPARTSNLRPIDVTTRQSPLLANGGLRATNAIRRPVPHNVLRLSGVLFSEAALAACSAGQSTVSGTHYVFVATTSADLVQLDHITKRVVHEDLFEMRPHYAGQRPVFDAEPVQLALGLLDVPAPPVPHG